MNTNSIRYYLVDLKDTLFTDQQHTGKLKCEYQWLYSVPCNPLWYTYYSKDETVVNLINVVDTDAQLQYVAIKYAE